MLGVLLGLTSALLSVPAHAALTPSEADQIRFLKEEEKLARDVYEFLGTRWPLAVFGNIARSEQTHMDQIDTLLQTHGLADPASPLAGVFNNPVLQLLYDRLTASGSVSLRAALGVGEMIEITDIKDLTDLLASTSLLDVITVAERLRAGSYNHLASFRNQLGWLPAPPALAPSPSQLVNLSARGLLGSGEESLIAGFVVAGDSPLRVMVVVRGPSLAAFGVADAASDPALELFRGDTLVVSNDNWLTDPSASVVRQQNLAALADQDAALFVDLAPGAYTFVASNHGAGTIGLAEIYALPRPEQTAQLVNLSVRGKTAPGDGRLIAGFVVAGPAPLPLVVRGLGLSLTEFGVTSVAPELDLELFATNTPPTLVQDWLGANVLGTVDAAYWPVTPLEPMDLVQAAPGALTAHAVDPTNHGGIVLLDVTRL